MKYILILFSFCFNVAAQDIPTFRFDTDITWKQIFDSGFRPKYFDDNQRDACICMDQVFWLQFQDREPKLKIEKGRVMFSFPIEHEIHMLWHQGLDPITLAEGQRRVDQFKKMFEGYIIQEITMPKIIDPSGLVDANNDENNIKARVGKYLIFYGFDNSFGTEKPIIPHFYIALSYSGKPDYRIKPMDYKIKPPAGYEWYSLDPKVSTPDPGSKTEQKVSNDYSPTHSKNLPREERKEKPREVAQTKNFQSLWILLAAIGALIAAYFVKRRLV